MGGWVTNLFIFDVDVDIIGMKWNGTERNGLNIECITIS